MPEYLRALVVILVLASATFFFAKTPATAIAIAPEDFIRRRNTWILLTLAGFLSQSYWVFAIIAIVVILNAAKKEPNKIAMFFFLVLALPQIRVEIPGLGGIRYIYAIDYVRILTACVLLPVCWEARRLAVTTGSLGRLPDKLLAAYIILNLVLQAQHDVATNVIRSALNWFIDVVVPYYAISRSIKDLKGFRDVLMSFVVAVAISSLIAVFELSRHWILYDSAGQALGVVWDSGYLSRGDLLRASATSGHSLVLGFVIAIGYGLLLGLRRSFPTSIQFNAACLLLIAGVLAALARGSWVGLVVMVLVFTLLGERPFKQFSRYALLAVPVGIALAFSEYGQRFVDLLPFIGTVDEFNVTYRQRLFDTSLQIVLDNPLFGSNDYLLHMEELRQGQGIIDLVNAYLIISLNTGLVGLALFVFFFLHNWVSAYKVKGILESRSELHLIGQSLLAVTIGVSFIIATNSLTHHVPLMLWSIMGLCQAFGAMKR